MPRDKIGSLPAFGTDTPSESESWTANKVIEAQPDKEDEQEQAAPESGAEPAEEIAAGEQEKETPSEPPTEEEPTAEPERVEPDDTATLQNQLSEQIEGLKSAKSELIAELKDLRGQKREAKKEQIEEVQEKIDDLNDVNQNDATLVDRIVRAKGFVSNKDVQRMILESKKQDELGKFFQQFPEYGTADNPTERWNGLLTQISLYYKEPSDPQSYARILRKAHTDLYGGSKSGGGRSATAIKRQVEIAGVGAGGTQRSSSVKSADSMSDAHKQRLLDGGWSEEEIREMEG